MIEIGKWLPNLTDPTATTGAAAMLAFKGPVLLRRDHAGQRRADQPRFDVSNIRVASRPMPGDATKYRLLHRREGGRYQDLIDDVVDNLAVFLGLGACREPFRIGRKGFPLLLALGERFPRQKIGQFLIG